METTQKNGVLSDVKPGESVCVFFQFYDAEIEEVVEVTDTYVITKQHRFLKSSGVAVGDDVDQSIVAQPLTADNVLKTRELRTRNTLISVLESTDFNLLSTEQLQAIHDIATNHSKPLPYGEKTLDGLIKSQWLAYCYAVNAAKTVNQILTRLSLRLSK